MIIEIVIVMLAVAVGFKAGMLWERWYWTKNLDALVDRMSQSFKDRD